jgi:chloramphenicol-sensitive protein RarD
METESHDAKNQRAALLAGIAAFATWGLIPIFWKQLTMVPASEILAHRFVWTCVFMVALLSWQGRWLEVREAFRRPRAAFFCMGSGLAIAINWLMFIWAVNAGRVLETSLGYFMTPLVNVLFGAIFLRERLTRLQLCSVFLAAAGVVFLTIGYGRFPWVALVLCSSFGLYGLLRKLSRTAAIPGLFFETALMTPIALGYLLLLQHRGALFFGVPHLSLSLLMVSSGLVTGVPLLWFAHAARYLRLTTLGFLQYLAPTGSFFLGVFLYHEIFTRTHLITFGLIWIALALFTGEAVFRWRAARAATPEGAPLPVG